MIQTLLIQVIAYLLANFILIPNSYLRELKSNRIKRAFQRAVIFFIVSDLVWINTSFVIQTILLTALVFFTSVYFESEKKFNRITEILHQVIQVAGIIIVVMLYYHVLENFNFQDIVLRFIKSTKGLFYLIAYLICLAPCNIFIKYFMKKFKFITDSKPDESLLNAGGSIGNIERILTLTLVFINKFEAIGFLIAAKSILRLRDSDKMQSEYILIGTLLSFGLALMVGIAVTKMLTHFSLF